MLVEECFTYTGYLKTPQPFFPLPTGVIRIGQRLYTHFFLGVQ